MAFRVYSSALLSIFAFHFTVIGNACTVNFRFLVMEILEAHTENFYLS